MQKIMTLFNRLWSRVIIKRLDNNSACQKADILMLASEQKTGIEHLEPYGFTSTSHSGAEGIALFLAGDRSHGVLINVADRRYRLKGMKSGEVAIYTDEGDSVVLKRGRLIEATTETFVIHAKKEVVLDTPQVRTSGSIISSKEVKDKTGSLSTMRKQYNSHTHRGDSGGTTGLPNSRME